MPISFSNPTELFNMQRRSILMGVFSIILIGAGVFAMNKLTSMKEEPKRQAPPKQVKRVQVQTVQNSAVESEVKLTGRLVAKNKVELFAEVSGVLQPSSSRFREGNYFQKGAPMLTIDKEEAQLTLMAQKAALLNQITLILPDLKLDYPEGYPEWQIYLDQFDPEKPIQKLPTPKTDAEKYFVSSKNLLNAYYNIRAQESRLRKYVVAAPFSGVVTEALIQAGTLVRSGQKLGTFTNTSTYELEAATSIDNINFFKQGAPVTISSTEVPGTWQGKVVRISKTLDASTQTVKVYILVQDKALREGMYMDAVVAGKKVEKAVKISRKLLNTDNEVFVLNDSIMTLQKVSPIKFTTESVIVKGLADGTRIVSESVAGAYDGLRVEGYQ